MKLAACLALAALALALIPSEPPYRLIGQCDGLTFYAIEEDHFPEGCETIEPIR